MTIASIAASLYEALKELYSHIDHDENKILKKDEFIYHEIKYTSKIQENIRKAIKNYEDYKKEIKKRGE